MIVIKTQKMITSVVLLYSIPTARKQTEENGSANGFMPLRRGTPVKGRLVERSAIINFNVTVTVPLFKSSRR